MIFTKPPHIIAGPCSVESYEQLRSVVDVLTKQGIVNIRGGIWKPRSYPNSFEGHGEVALKWVAELKKEFIFHFATEVATPRHVELALKYKVDSFWLGARTTTNPFMVQEIADALKGSQVPVLVKNPVSPDLPLWLGAIERIKLAGIKDVNAIHRGFTPFERRQYRNIPFWPIIKKFKEALPETLLLCDPSHIAGSRELIPQVMQEALENQIDGFMIEVHSTPEMALSDAAQQITPARLINQLHELNIIK